MNKILLIAGFSLICTAPVFANADLAKAKGCLGCHTVDAKLVGPAYKDVAKKYAGDKTAAAKLAKKIRDGGTGVWGTMPMPPMMAMVSEAEAKTLATWILSQK